MRKILTVGAVCLYCASACCCSNPLTGTEPADELSADFLFRRELDLRANRLDLTNEAWTLTDEAGMSKPVKVGLALTSQGYSKGDYTYTLSFDSDELLSDGDDLYLLELGPVSQSDETRLNGHLLGGYGKFPPPFRVAHFSDQIQRRYVIPSSWFNREEANCLEVKIATGTIGGTIAYAGGGIFQGPVTITPLRQRVLLDYELRDPALSSVKPLLSSAAYLNNFVLSDNLNMRVRLAPLNPASELPGADVLVYLDGSAEPIVERKVSLTSGHWSQWLSIQFSMPQPGNHTYEVVVRNGDDTLYRDTIPFSVLAELPSQGTVAVDNTIGDLDGLKWQNVSSRSVGSFGARNADSFGILDPDNWNEDVRGTLTTTVHVGREGSPPLLLFPGTQLPPIPYMSAEDYQEFPLGREYDGFGDTWPLGFIQLGDAVGGECVFETANWVSRTYLLKGHDDLELGELKLSKLSPALRLNAKTSSATFFQGLANWGLGAPTRMAYAGLDTVETLSRGKTLDGELMQENWVLVWFNGANGWDDFDIPWILVFERRPSSLQLTEDGLRMSRVDQEALGHVYAMPLYGLRLLEPERTANWANRIAEDTLLGIRRWSKALLAYPVDMERSIAVDWEANNVYLREKVMFEETADEWSTSIQRIIPTPPVLGLALHSENLEVTASENVHDFDLVTTFGPFLGATETDRITYKAENLLQYVGQAQVLADNAGNSALVADAKLRLGDAARALVTNKKLYQHPWPWSIWRGKFTPGYSQSQYSSILASLPYLDESFREKLGAMMRDEVNQIFLPLTLGSDASARGGWTPQVGEPLYQIIEDPLTGQTLAVLSDHVHRRAIDTPFWQSFQLYTIWQTAHYLDNWESTADQWEHLCEMAELPLHSHDWATLQSWDFFSGYRIGNGLQESGGIYAGYVAMTRMADHFGYSDERDLWAGLSALHLIGLSVANTTIDYVRLYRPWSGRHSTGSDIARAEMTFPSRYVEYNEFSGADAPAIHLPWLPLINSSYIHDLLPDVMRIYPELWPQQNAFFFDQQSFDAPLEMLVHMQRIEGARVEDVYRKQVQSPKDLERLMAARALLESIGSVTWEDVIDRQPELGADEIK